MDTTPCICVFKSLIYSELFFVGCFGGLFLKKRPMILNYLIFLDHIFIIYLF